MSSTTSYDTIPKRARWPWVLLFLLVGLIGVAQCYRLIQHTRVRSEMAALRKQGYPITGRELAAWLPAVPDKENAAIKIMEAAELREVPQNGINASWSRTEKIEPDEKAELQTLLTNNANALEVLHSAAKLDKSRFPLDYTAGPAMLFPHLAKMKSLTQLLKVQTVLASDDGQLDLAVKSVIDSISVARSLDNEPILISQLVRIACLSIMSTSLERLLTQHALSEAQLHDLYEAVHAANDTTHTAFSQSFLGEISLGSFCFTAPPTQLTRILDDSSTGSGELNVASVAFPIYAWTGLRDRDFLFYLRMMHRTLEAAKTPFPEGLNKARGISKDLEDAVAANKLLIISRMLLPALQKSMDKEAELEGRLRSAEVALAVERYRAIHNGALPDDLTQLVPGTIPRVPSDPIDGAPLRYHKAEHGYVVYSIGLDGEDEGGMERVNSSGSNSRKGPPGKKGSERKAVRMGNGNAYDVTFTVER